MSLRSWLFGDHTKADRAIQLADEVAQLARDKGRSRDPIRALLSELIFHRHDVALVADAYEISQESRIYRGPETRSQ